MEGGVYLRYLKEGELGKITGGFSVWGGIAITAAIVFLSGVIEGFANPGGCNNWYKTI